MNSKSTRLRAKIGLPYNRFTSLASLADSEDLVCFSPVRWKALTRQQRNLISRFAARWRVFVVEEPPQQVATIQLHSYDRGCLYISARDEGVWSVAPYLPQYDYGCADAEKSNAAKQRLIGQLFDEAGIHEPIMWYLTPAAIAYTRNLCSWITIYDCTEHYEGRDDFDGAECPNLSDCESELLKRADLMLDRVSMPTSVDAAWTFVRRSIMQAAHSHHFKKLLAIRAGHAV